MNHSTTYPIGNPGQPWDESHKTQWLSNQSIQRSYLEEVLSKLAVLPDCLDKSEYGQLDYVNNVYPLYLVKNRQWIDGAPIFLVTGGVHGYETSGVQGAIHFLLYDAQDYIDKVNILVAPCVSPWAYETINRWNPHAIDPNRSFFSPSPARESALLMNALAPYLDEIICHVDLHETTDTDNSEFRPALAARDGKVNHNWNIPDGFYLVGDTHNLQPAFQNAVIDAVEQVTHIAPPDNDGKIIGVPIDLKGVINYDKKALGLCGGMTNASYVTTTEVYPDSESATPDMCIDAQVAAIRGAIDFVIGQENI
ncbi:M14 family metallocarboxypeptidase [Aestuariibacter sp. AA17]|uniref:M14 family metallocarboxypeptidase n=1 Tax=Fluctibacter corallii TaxID=2984329 RepID=A0ABT3A3W3_9ALTE|nr:M14 family metallocarboxypeptidase [Aestuariibacter sp. AA17]MCV2883377.1 M14 family metallocarboxypeptidase [Aestuariibacter sp. AA17]